MNLLYRVFITTITCLSVTAIHGERQYVIAEKENKSSPAGSIEVAIIRAKRTPSDNPLISHNIFKATSPKKKLFFDFDKGDGKNEVEVYPIENKKRGARLSVVEFTAAEVPAGSKIMIHENGIPYISPSR